MHCENIFLIDDDEDCLFLTSLSIKKLDLFRSIKTFTSGGMALRFLEEHCVDQPTGICPHVIIVDNNMPDMNGFVFLQKMGDIKGMPEDKPIVYMASSFSTTPGKEELQKYGIKDVIDKPLTMDKLRQLFAKS